MSNENDHIRWGSTPTTPTTVADNVQSAFDEPLDLSPRKTRRKKRKGRQSTANDAVIPGACMGPKPSGLVKIVVQKPFCTPVRSIITSTPACPLYKAGLRYWDFADHPVVKMDIKNAARRMKVELKHFENLKYGPAGPGFLPMACEASFWVTPAQQQYATYLVERTGRMYVTEGGINVKKNRQWADKHGGEMPKPWYEPGCSEGKSIFGQVGKIVQKAKRGK